MQLARALITLERSHDASDRGSEGKSTSGVNESPFFDPSVLPQQQLNAVARRDRTCQSVLVYKSLLVHRSLPHRSATAYAMMYTETTVAQAPRSTDFSRHTTRPRLPHCETTLPLSDEDDEPLQSASQNHPRLPFLASSCTCLKHAPNLYTQTTHIRELQSFDRNEKPLGIFQHESFLLAEKAIASFSESSDSMLQNLARDVLAGFCATQGRRTAVVSLDVAAETFNNIFFLGQLQDIRIRFTSGACFKRGYTSTTVNQSTSTVEATVWLNPHHPVHCRNHQAMLETLLHELCHAFLQRHSCYRGQGEGCYGNMACLKLCKQNHGATGHGRAWQVLAAAVEQAASRLLVQRCGMRKLDLGRLEAAVNEMACTQTRSSVGGLDSVGRWWPSKCDLEHLSGEGWWRITALMRSRDDDFVLVQKLRSWIIQLQHCSFRNMFKIRAQRIQRWCSENVVRVQSSESLVFDPKKRGLANEI